MSEGYSYSQIIRHKTFTQLHYTSVFRFSCYISFPAGWALSCCNKPEETQIFVHVAHINPCAQNLFLDSCQLWLHLIWYGCFLIIPDVQRSDLNKSATGTEVPPPDLLIAIVSPWKVFQNTAVVFSWWGKCVDGFHSNAEMGGAVGAKACEMCWKNEPWKQMKKGTKWLEERLWKRLALASSPGGVLKYIFGATLGVHIQSAFATKRIL